MHTAVGIHVFAGGFTRGVLDAGWKVPVQLEVHNFGLETTEKMNGVPSINDENARWPDVEGLMSFGNPRCTAFSTITNGAKYEDSNSHGAWAKQTCDIHQMCEYSAGRFDFVVWESVQQAYKASGRELVDHLVREVFAPKHYRVAHLFINAATFGNAQQRKRYFFMAYRDCYKFCIQPPSIAFHYPVVYDVIWDRRDRQTRPADLSMADYDEDSHCDLRPDEWAVVPELPCGWGMHALARYRYDVLTERQKAKWDTRASELPFSLHGISRTNWLRPCPTMHSGVCRFIHPSKHRPLTVGEMAALMGWPTIPVGPYPNKQIVKGICPEVGQWLVQQVELSYSGHWGSDDWESSYDARDAEWKGGDATGKLEKIFDMTQYVGYDFDLARYPDEALMIFDPHAEPLTRFRRATRERVR